ncbi:ribonucleotide-diphosphate reductase subunit beta [Candidatus Gromoviella agglomerans]|uniref:ribonucleotide-diphosphate reductase subunit beta n=1 Tax=Candidatus Gromoviella agglomerans TaxID=2806609 RepID=UPI001E63145F|nr:ribonucleotide-diphosphate reductase subunit beta [Candidatus Gromoviella agglomerans]UFX98373.1 Ribonucleoside-diphosphate reductase subunit beta [Candidatus Gromoviella agglomerans]
MNLKQTFDTSSTENAFDSAATTEDIMEISTEYETNEYHNDDGKINSRSPLFNKNPVYKPFRYPWAFDSWLTQQKIIWLPEEVLMNDDIVDWRFVITDDERDLLMNIFRFFTQSDIEVNNCYMKYYMNVFCPIEIQMMLSAFSNMETIHIHGYSFLMDTLEIDEGEYTAFLEYKEMKDKWEYLQKYGDYSLRGIAITLARFGAFTEGLQLFAAFAILMNFQRFGKMKGMGQIVAWSIRDETLHMTSMIKLFHTLIKEHPFIWSDSFEKELMMECKRVVELEDAFIDLAFKGRYVEGISAEESKQYIRYIANRRLKQLGTSPLYTVNENPYPWMEQLQNEFVNFFENRPSEYSKASTKGNWTDAFSYYEKYAENNKI